MADFKAWVRMMGNNGSSQQTLHFRVSTPNLATLVERLNAKDFLLVEQLNWDRGGWKEVGQIVLNRRALVRIQPLRDAAEAGTDT